MINYHQDDSPQRWFAWISGGESLLPLFIPIVGASSSPLLFGNNNELSLNFKIKIYTKVLVKYLHLPESHHHHVQQTAI